MYYYLNTPLKSMDKVPDEERDFVAYLTLEQFERDASKLGIDNDLLELCREPTNQNTITAWDTYSFGILNLPDINRVFEERDLIGVYLDDRKLIIIDLLDRDQSTRGAFLKSLNMIIRKINLGRFFFLFIKEITKGQYGVYNSVLKEIQELENSVWTDLDEDVDSYGRRISKISRQLLFLHSYYEEIADLLSELEENENGILDKQDLGYIRSLLSRIEHYSSNMRFLREYLDQVRETYQSQLDLKQNEIMKIFTVLTAVFLPLTLVAGWYGMNFKYMPELSWRYGYVGVIGLSLAITLSILLYFRKKRLL